MRLMVQLGRHYGSGPASLAEIAAEEELPRPYLEQLALGLREAGLVTSTRGARGGYELARPPDQIGMLEILRALEGPIAPMICVTDEAVEHICGRTARCTVNLLWLRIRDAVAGALETLTLADFLPPRPVAAELVAARRHVSADGRSVPIGSVPVEPLAPSALNPASATSQPNVAPEPVAQGPIGGGS